MDALSIGRSDVSRICLPRVSRAGRAGIIAGIRRQDQCSGLFVPLPALAAVRQFPEVRSGFLRDRHHDFPILHMLLIPGFLTTVGSAVFPIGGAAFSVGGAALSVGGAAFSVRGAALSVRGAAFPIRKTLIAVIRRIRKHQFRLDLSRIIGVRDRRSILTHTSHCHRSIRRIHDRNIFIAGMPGLLLAAFRIVDTIARDLLGLAHFDLNRPAGFLAGLIRCRADTHQAHGHAGCQQQCEYLLQSLPCHCHSPPVSEVEIMAAGPAWRSPALAPWLCVPSFRTVFPFS